MLNLAYTAQPYKYVSDGDFRYELEDSYIRLDGQLSRLFEAIDKYVGLDNTLVYVASTGYYDDAVADDPKYRTPTGDFSVKRALSLLNSYLSARYGNGDYVDTYSGSHVYLDHKQIEAMKLDLNEVAEASRDFLVRMSGVNDAYTMGDIMTSALPKMEALRLGTDPKTGGDVVLEFNEGWNIVDDTRFPNDVQVARSSMVLSPFFIMGCGIAPVTIETPVDATALAPTVTQVLRIRSPNGAVSKPVSLPRK
ncbi:alkaline phosphatase family protein [Duncaniella muris]|uniref:alkaline phosphatase family protein n=1 Tax=Duncaniella muris TaxID=2094150 RepID=UPI00272F81AF|nr:alkaline phosphatase family protein [Duncaniella muris]